LAGGAGDKPANATEVKIDNFSFGPATVTIPVGSTITWTNNDDVPHVVSSDDNKMFQVEKRWIPTTTSRLLSQKPGTYNYLLRNSPEDGCQNRSPVSEGRTMNPF